MSNTFFYGYGRTEEADLPSSLLEAPDKDVLRESVNAIRRELDSFSFNGGTDTASNDHLENSAIIPSIRLFDSSAEKKEDEPHFGNEELLKSSDAIGAQLGDIAEMAGSGARNGGSDAQKTDGPATPNGVRPGAPNDGSEVPKNGPRAQRREGSDSSREDDWDDERLEFWKKDARRDPNADRSESLIAPPPPWADDRQRAGSGLEEDSRSGDPRRKAECVIENTVGGRPIDCVLIGPSNGSFNPSPDSYRDERSRDRAFGDERHPRW